MDIEEVKELIKELYITSLDFGYAEYQYASVSRAKALIEKLILDVEISFDEIYKGLLSEIEEKRKVIEVNQEAMEEICALTNTK